MKRTLLLALLLFSYVGIARAVPENRGFFNSGSENVLEAYSASAETFIIDSTGDGYFYEDVNITKNLTVTECIQAATAVIDQATISGTLYAPGIQTDNASAGVVGVTADLETSATGYVDVADMVTTITTGDCTLFVNVSGVFKVTNANSILYCIIEVDSVEKSGSERCNKIGSLNTPRVIPTAWIGDVSAGEHTIQLRWKVTAGTATAEGTRRSMQVIELR